MNVCRLASADDSVEAVVAAAVEALGSGGVLVYPTDTLYAIGGRANDAASAAAVRSVKGRDDGNPLPLIAASVDQVLALALPLAPAVEALARRFWPGPLTLVLPLGGALPDTVTSGNATIAIRVPAASFARALCERAGPLVSTSANKSGGAPPHRFADAAEAVGHVARLLIDAGSLPGTPSTIVDMTSGSPRLVREGSVAWSDVLLHWNSPA